MAAITFPSTTGETETEPRGARARAAAVRTRATSGGGDRVARRTTTARPALFSGDGQLRPAPPVRFASVPLVANDDLASLSRTTADPAPAGRRAVHHLVAVAEPVRTARPAGSATAPTVRSTARATSAATATAKATAPQTSAATYRRRRVAAAALFLGALLAGGGALGALGGGPLTASESGSSSPTPVELRVQPVSRSTYVVAPGDTLWSIARALQPEGDVRPVVDALAATRGGRPLEVGETIVLP